MSYFRTTGFKEATG